MIAALLLACLIALTLGAPITDQTMIKKILDLHTAARAEVGRTALTWDTQTANEADKTSSACTFEHTSLEIRMSTNSGENMAWGGGMTADDGVKLWIGEKPNFICNVASPNFCTNGFGSCGHYSQVIWPSTTKIGCAITACQGGVQLLVCQYKGAGNMQGEKVPCGSPLPTNAGSQPTPGTPASTGSKSTPGTPSSTGSKSTPGTPSGCTDTPSQHVVYTDTDKPAACVHVKLANFCGDIESTACQKSCGRCTSNAESGGTIAEDVSTDESNTVGGSTVDENNSDASNESSDNVPGYAIGLLVIGTLCVVSLVAVIAILFLRKSPSTERF